MTNDATGNQLQDAENFQDFHAFKNHSKLKKNEMFDPQFLDFMKWLRKDVHKTYTTEDFRRMERRNVSMLMAGFAALIATYVVLHTIAPQYAIWWGIPMFMVSIYFCIKAEVLHMRTHSPANLTGSKPLDTLIDHLGLPFSGVSISLLRRRHLAAHYNDVGSVSKLFSNVWLTFNDVPIIYYLRPFKLIKFLSDPQFCKRENIDRGTLAIETFGFYLYLIALPVELFVFDSYFLLMFHLIPALFVAGTQIVGAIVAHSGLDEMNSFESCGIIDPDTVGGLFKVSIKWFNLFNAKFFVNHAIHHAYPQMPLELINKNYKRYYAHILDNYENVRYNKVLQHRIHGDILDRMPEPAWYDYIVQFFVVLFVHFTFVLIGVGVPFPPVLFELAMVDYRVYFKSTYYERMVNKVKFMDSINLMERFQVQEEPNMYLKFMVWQYRRFQKNIAKHEARQAARY